MKRVRWLLITSALMLCYWHVTKATVSADNVNSQYSYSVEVDDQKNTSSIQKHVSPNQKLNVKLVFANNSAQVQRLNVNFNTATTGDNGVVQYNFSNLNDRYLGNVNFAKLVNGKKLITLAAKSKVIENYTITVPRKSFNGVIAGGFYITQAKSKHGIHSKNGVSFKNVISYAIPIVLRERNQQVNTKLNLNRVNAKIHYADPTVIAKIDNLTPTLFGQMNINAKIIDKNTNRIVFKQQQGNMAMAPLTRMAYPITIDQKLNPGQYLLKLAISSGKAHWHFTKPFEINAKISQATSKSAPAHAGMPIWVYVAIGGAVLLALLSGVYYLGTRKVRSN
ncbi:DUF916 and DUF3324 domain-containing protein [Nicoliella spurrieriana]|uniref:DUF916 and DUF3324 domain-containing protein n=1 Tax=Nicoliella spurrieriana TaxID=2925830 RepID=A0A976RRJ9_9LACO|nr:DUF916 and DUF3324 domain-containing protein [Nicoliella spurrieriana]